jgi:hypothetical protein
MCNQPKILKANEAYEFLKCSGYPSPEEAIHLFHNGNIFGLLELSREDLIRAYDTNGIQVVYVQCKLTNKAIAHAVIYPTAIIREKMETLHTDVILVHGYKF